MNKPGPSPELGSERLLAFFKALSDANRLKIIGLLAQDDYTVEQLAEVLALSPSTVSHHLARLSQVGLVSARAESYYNIYQLKFGVLEELARSLLVRESLPAVTADINVDAYDRKVLRDFLLPDGRLKAIPAQHKKQLVVLRHIAQAIEPGLTYTEKQVNEKLQLFFSDWATLRRLLIVEGFLVRSLGGKEYWRVEPPQADGKERNGGTNE